MHIAIAMNAPLRPIGENTNYDHRQDTQRNDFYKGDCHPGTMPPIATVFHPGPSTIKLGDHPTGQSVGLQLVSPRPRTVESIAPVKRFFMILTVRRAM
jgi:hypothetical protein